MTVEEKLAGARVKIREYIQENMSGFFDDEWADTDNIFEKGFVSSMFAMQLLNFVETEFSIEIQDEDIRLDNFKSIDSMINLLGRMDGILYAD